MRTILVEGPCRLHASKAITRRHTQKSRHIVIVVTIEVTLSQVGIVSIGIGAIAATIDIAPDITVNTYGSAAIDHAADIVAAIDIVDGAAIDHQSGCILSRIGHTIDDSSQDIVLSRIDVGHSASTIDIVHLQIVGAQHQDDTLRVGHGTMVTTRVEVTYLAFFQMPLGSNGHISLVVASEDTRELVVRTRSHALVHTSRITQVVHTHVFQTLISQFAGSGLLTVLIALIDIIGNRAGIIDTDIGSFPDSHIVATSIENDARATTHLNINSVSLRLHKRGETCSDGLVTTLGNILAVNG